MDCVLKTTLLLVLTASDAYGLAIESRYFKAYKGQALNGGTTLVNSFYSGSRFRCMSACALLSFCGSGYYTLSTRRCVLMYGYEYQISLTRNSNTWSFTKRPCVGVFELYSKSDWKAETPTQAIPGLSTPVSYVVLHAAAAERYNYWPDDCGNLDNCLKTMKDIQHYDISETVVTHGDIDTNFCLDASGRFYEGRGWNHKSQYRSETSQGRHVAITIFGDYESKEPTLKSKAALRAFCACAVERGHLTKNFHLIGHDQDVSMPPRMCPGQAMRAMIRRWPSP